jgi:hypothetical protein
VIDHVEGRVDVDDEDLALRQDFVKVVLREVLLVGPALLGDNTEIYAEQERVRAEGEFRDAIFLPLILFWLLVVAESGSSGVEILLAVIVGLLVSAGVFLQARKLTRVANSQLAHVVANGDVMTAALRAVDDRPSRLAEIVARSGEDRRSEAPLLLGK